MIEQYTKRAVTLIEVTIAIALLLLILGGLTTTFSQGSRLTRRHKGRVVAYNLARAKFEEKFISFPANETSNITLNDIAYNITFNVTDGPIYPSELKRFDVIVSWDNDQRNVTIATMKGNF